MNSSILINYPSQKLKIFRVFVELRRIGEGKCADHEDQNDHDDRNDGRDNDDEDDDWCNCR